MTAPWWEAAACKGQWLDLFFSPSTEHAAKRICAGCHVADACLSDAMSTPRLVGVFGGTTERDRARIRRRRQSAAS